MEKTFVRMAKGCPYCADKTLNPDDYRDARMLSRFVTERGRLIPARVSGLCSKHQRAVTRAIKRARYLAFMPFVAND